MQLTYPIGLITIDEVNFAGTTVEGTNNSFYLTQHEGLFTLSLTSRFLYGAYASHIYNNRVGDMANGRPVINLKPSVTITSGDGTEVNPYVIN